MEAKTGACKPKGRGRKARGERLFSSEQLEHYEVDATHVRVRRYDSFGEWMEHAEWWCGQCNRGLTQDEAVDAFIKQHALSGWFCGAWGSVRRGLEALRNGEATPAALKKMEEWRERISVDIDAPTLGNTRRRHFVFADQGDEVDADRFNAEHERPWRTMRRGRVAPMIRLGIDSTVMSTDEDDDFSRIGGMVGSVCDVLARQGRSVEVVLFETERVKIGNKAGHWVHMCTLKAAHEQMELERIASVATPAFARFVCSITDVFDAGQFLHAMYREQVIRAAKVIGIDALINIDTNPATLARDLLMEK